VFEPEQMLPAAGQGALGIEVRSNRADVGAALQCLVHQPTWLAVSAERAVSRVMGGSCSMPLAAYATLDGDVLHIRATWGDPEGVLPLVHAQATATVTDTASAMRVGEQVARQLQDAVRQQAAGRG
jgi:hydroxymethylbilane synthase